MIKTYLLEDLDCAHCAGKIQEETSKLDGVKNCTVTFLTQKMVLEMEDSKEKEIEAAMKKIVKKLEPDVIVVTK